MKNIVLAWRGLVLSRETDLETDYCYPVRETKSQLAWNVHSSYLPINWGLPVINIQVYLTKLRASTLFLVWC